MPLFLANLAMSSYFLALCYVLATVLTINKYAEVRRALRRHQRAGWSTVQLLILSVALGCLFRATTFSTLCIFDSQSAADLPSGGGGGLLHPSNKGGGGGVLLPPPDVEGDDASGSDATGRRERQELDFYNKVVAVLFNLPDFLFVSSYLLLVLVWAEAFQSVCLCPSRCVSISSTLTNVIIGVRFPTVAAALVLGGELPPALDDLLPRVQRRAVPDAGRALREPVPARQARHLHERHAGPVNAGTICHRRSLIARSTREV